MRTVTKTGLDAVVAVTDLLQQIHRSHPHGGLYQAAELQFWWSRPRRTDDLAQLFWVDDDERPIAAAVVVDFGDSSSLLYDEVTLCPFVLAGSSADHVAAVLDAGLAHVASLGFEAVELEVAHDDTVLRAAAEQRGFEVQVPEMLVECWLQAGEHAPINPLPEGYRLASRAELGDRPHHMNRTPDEDIEARLSQLSLYDPRHDLVVLTSDDTPAANGMFWFDPVTRTGTVEPMRTGDDHQNRGLGRHVLTSGVDLLIRAGAERVSIGYAPDNPGAGHLYRSVGFQPVGGSALWQGPTRSARVVSRSS